MMPRSLAALALAALLTQATPTAAAPQSETDALNVPYTRYTLENGLTVILHEDHNQPLVVVNVSYQVGSRDEVDKRTGFAHLFEHLMFMGTKRVPLKKFDEWMERAGGWNNAWTSEDRTDYFDVAPSHALPLLLWMEADRLSALGREINPEKLEAQREVVRNERRQSVENEPYGIAELRLPELLFPAGHPYHHPVIGSHEDLEAATVNDVRAFFAVWYRPQNASLVVAGDFDPKTTKDEIQRLFGHLSADGAPSERKKANEARLGSVVRETLTDKVSVPKLIIAWLSPALFTRGDAELDLTASILSHGKASRLYKALVYDRELAQSVSAFQSSGQLQSHFNIEVVARPGVTLAELEQVIDAEIKKLRDEPVTEAELERAKNQYEVGFVTQLQSLASRADMLNRYQATVGNPGYASADLQRYRDVSVADVQTIARQTLDPNARVILHIVPAEVKP